MITTLTNTSASGSPKHVTRGGATTIIWSVTGGTSPSCAPSFQGISYPDNRPTDSVYIDWIGSSKPASGSLPLSVVLGNTSLSYPQTYVFKCTEPISNAFDTATLIVDDCTSPQVWNNTSHSCVDPAASCGVVTKSWNSCSGPTVSTPSGAPYQVQNNVNGYSGSATYLCTNGTWSTSPSSSSCLPNPSPDLTAGGVTPTSVVAGTSNTFSATITNIGGATTGASFTNLLQYSATGQTLDGEFTQTMPAKIAGANGPFSVNLPVPNTPGTAYLRACADLSGGADQYGVISESDELNNCGPWTAITITDPDVPQIPQCSATHWNCSIGTMSAAAGTGPWTWSCTGANGGGTIPCSQAATCSDVNANNYGEAGACTYDSLEVTVRVSPSSYATTPSTKLTVRFTSSASDDNGTNCRVQKTTIGTPTPTSTYYSGTTTLTFTSPSTNGEYTYFVKCRAESDSNASSTDNFYFTVCPFGYIWNNTVNQCVVPSDLTASIIETSTQGGSDRTFRATYSNIGLGSTIDNFKGEFEYSSDGGSDWSDFSESSLSALVSGATSSANGSRNFNNAGTYLVRACADSHPDITESDETNNCSSNITFTTGPDLTAGSITPTVVPANTNTNYTATITNIGDQDTNDTFKGLIQRATLPNGGGTINDVGNGSVDQLDPGETDTITKSYKFVTAGNYSMRACADKNSAGDVGDVDESNENNNCGPWTNICVGTALQCPGLPPEVVNPLLSGNNTPTGSLSFSCNYSFTYSIIRDGVTLVDNASYTGAITYPITVEGNYSMVCLNGALSDTEVVYYDPTVIVPTNLSLTATPRSISTNEKVTLQWSITDPDTSCRIVATPICTGTCDATRINAASALQSILDTSSTDSNDPFGASRTMTSALRTPYAVGGTKAQGKKTLQVLYTTDFKLQCGAAQASTTIRVLVTSKNEG
ncbi:MAG: CARDB domain-containing protein [Candidatus Paceibacterota bacterium]